MLDIYAENFQPGDLIKRLTPNEFFDIEKGTIGMFLHYDNLYHWAIVFCKNSIQNWKQDNFVKI